MPQSEHASWNLAVEELQDHHNKNKLNIYDKNGDYLAKKQGQELKNRKKDRDKFLKGLDKEIEKIAKKQGLNPEQLKYEWTVRQLVENNFVMDRWQLDKEINKSKRA